MKYGTGLGGVCAYLERSGVIGENHYFEVLAAFPEISVHGTENFFADLFDRIYLVLDFAAVSAFVGSFHVNIYEIRAVAEGFLRRFSLARIVGLVISRGSLDRDHIHPRAKTDSLYEIDGGDYRSLYAPLFREGGKRGFGAGAPEPCGVGGLQPGARGDLRRPDDFRVCRSFSS